MAKIGMNKKWWMLLLGVWLVLHALHVLIDFHFAYFEKLQAMILLLAGIFLIIDW